MKKLLLSMCLLGASALTSSMYADNFTVYADGALTQGLDQLWWWNASYGSVANPDGTGQVYHLTYADGGADASMGIMTTSGVINTGKLHNATLNFQWYAKGTGNYAIRLTAEGNPVVSQDYNFTVTADNAGKWNSVSLPVATTFANVAKAWNENAANGKGYVFGIVLSNGSPDAEIFFNNIYYSDIDTSWAEPSAPEKPAAYPDGTVFAVWPASTESGVINISCQYYNWGGVDSSGSEDGVPYSSISGNGNTWFGGGFLTNADFNMETITENNYDLVFDVRLSSEDIQFRLKVENQGATNSAYETAFFVGAVNEWVPMRINLKQYFAAQMEAYSWTDRLYIFCPVANSLSGGTLGSDCRIDFRNVRVEPYQTPDAVPAGTTWYGSLDFTQGEYEGIIDYKFVVNEEQNFTVYANVVPNKEIPGMGVQINTGGDNWYTLTKTDEDADYPYSVTVSQTYLKGDMIHCFFYLPYTGGAARVDFDYSFGASNEKPNPKPVIIASVEDITQTSANIQYSVELPAELTGATVTVYLDGEAITTGSPIALSDLTAGTAYSHTLTATANLNGTDYEATAVTLNFTTLYDESDVPVSSGIVEGTLVNASINGETKDLPVTLSYSITYNPEKTLTVEFTSLTEDFDNVVGMVPQLFLYNGYKGNFSVAPTRAKSWTITTTDTFERGDVVPVGIYCAYAVGSTNIHIGDYVVGQNVAVSVERVEAAAATTGDIYNINGVRVARGVDFESVKANLAPGIYIVNGKKVVK